MNVELRPATDRFDDFATVVGPKTGKNGCWCMAYRNSGLDAEVVEGYPADPGDGRVDVVSGYVGTTRLFEAHGFTRAVQTTGVSGGSPRWVMRREL